VTLVEDTAVNGGMPYISGRNTYCHHPVNNLTEAEAEKFILENDPIKGKPILQEIVEALTVPLSADESKTGTIEIKRDRLLPADTEANLKEFYYQKGWYDGLPFILPTEENVAAMMKGNSHKSNEVIGTMGNYRWTYDMERVAVNAVMAGATPELFPTILAIASTGQMNMSSSTTSMLRWLVFNGPIRDELNMNMGIGSQGPFFQRNCALIARSWQFMTRNLGGCVPGTTIQHVQGNALNYISPMVVECEEALPAGWLSYSQEVGYGPKDSVVTGFGGWTFFNSTFFKAERYSDTMRRETAASEFSGTGGHHTTETNIHHVISFIIDPAVAKTLKETEGFNSKSDLCDWLLQNSFFPWSNYWQMHAKLLEQAKAGVEPYATYLTYNEQQYSVEPVMVRKPTIIVQGANTNPFWKMVDGSPTRSARIDDWK
jgi:hypothetical protein